MCLQVLVEMPFILVQTTYYTLIVYSMVSFQWTAPKFFWFYFINFFSFLYFTYYGMMTVSITPNHHVAAIFAAAFYALFNLFSGFFVPRPVSRSFPSQAWMLWESNLNHPYKSNETFWNFREFPSGGCGIIGSARLRGPCTGWSYRSMETTRLE